MISNAKTHAITLAALAAVAFPAAASAKFDLNPTPPRRRRDRCTACLTLARVPVGRRRPRRRQDAGRVRHRRSVGGRRASAAAGPV
jgi:hypothetical protein